MNHIHKAVLIFCCINATTFTLIQAQNKFLGIPDIQYFGMDDYPGHISNAFVSQDHRGVIYAANERGLLEFDGSHWKIDHKTNERGVTALYPDPSGRLYAGRMAIGYYFPGPNGKLAFQSFDQLLPEDHRVMGIMNILPYKGGYVFVGHETLYLYDHETVRLLPTKYPWSWKVHVCGEELFMSPGGAGLSVFNGMDWDLIPNGEYYANMLIASILDVGDGSMLVFTENNGSYLMYDSKIKPFASQLWEDFIQVSNAIKLTDGNYAISTSNGLFIVDQTGLLVYHFNSESGLSKSQIRDVFEDADGNIWLARENGLVKIAWSSSVSYINEKLGLPGVGFCALEVDDQLFFGTSTGLYQATKEWPIKSIRPVDNIREHIFNIQEINGQILVCGFKNSYQMIGNKFVPISPGSGLIHYGFRMTKDPNIMIRGSVHGIHRIEKINNKWVTTKKYKGFEEWTKFLEFDEEGILWTTSASKGVFSFTFSEDYEEVVSMKSYNQADGLPSNMPSKVFKINDELIFSTIRNGIYQYDPSTGSFQSSSRWNDRFQTNQHIYAISTDASGNIYFCDTKQVSKLEKNISNEYSKKTYLLDDIDEHLQGLLTVLDPANILYAHPQGFMHYSGKQESANNPTPEVLIRSVNVLGSDSVLHGGSFTVEEKVVAQQPADKMPSISYKNNSLAIGYSAIQYNNKDVLYRYQLDGFDPGWSQWTPKTEKEYTNLPEGTYVFRVQMIGKEDQLSPTATYSFRIHHPWYRTQAAYIGYGLGIIGIFTLVFFWYRKKYTAEIGSLRKANIQIEIQHKKQQLAATAMHLVNKTVFINSVKEKLGEVLNSTEEKDINLGIRRVIKSIERNAMDDNSWEDFEIHFDEVHHGFLRKLRKDYPKITPQEIKLSAYLRMNMSTKEIANLLKVSVRGVEMARFRLRRKLNMKKEENLVSFMMNY